MSSKTGPRPWSLAARLTAWYAGSAFALVLVTTGFLYWALVQNLDREDEQALRAPVRDMRALLASLPMAGFSGTLSAGQSVFSGIGGAALGRVRAKTGNLGTVTALAGLASDASGAELAFAFMADKIPAAGRLQQAANAIDNAAEALAGCGCRLRELAAPRTVGL